MPIPTFRRILPVAAAALLLLPACREERPATVLLHVDHPDLAGDPGLLLTDALLLAVVDGATLADWPEFAGLAPRAVARRVRRAVDLAPGGGDRLVRLTVSLGGADTSRRLANLLADHLAARHRELVLAPLEQRAGRLLERTGAALQSLARLDRQIDALPESDPDVLALRLEEVRGRLLRSGTEADQLELALAADRPLEDLLASLPGDSLPAERIPELEGTGEIAGQDAALETLRRELASLEEEYGPAYPRIHESRERIAALEAERDLARARAVARFRRGFRERETRLRVLLDRRAEDLRAFRELAAAARSLDDLAASREEHGARLAALRSEQAALDEARARARSAVVVLEYAAVPLE